VVSGGGGHSRGLVRDRRHGRCVKFRGGAAVKWVAKEGIVEQVGREELDQIVAEGVENPGAPPVIIDFYATWCGPCQIIANELKRLAVDYGGRVRILKVDTDREDELATLLMIRGLPTLMFVREGKLLYRMEGALPYDQLRMLTDELFFRPTQDNNPDTASVQP